MITNCLTQSGIVCAEPALQPLPVAAPRLKVVRVRVSERTQALAPLVKNLLRQHEGVSVGGWMVSFAQAWVACSRHAVPERWLQKLSDAFGVNPCGHAVPRGLFECLPPGVWSDGSALGEILGLVRQQDECKRSGRSGRTSEGSVYTPAAVARKIAGEVHIGARRVVDPACGAGVFLIESFRRAFRRRVENGAPPWDAARAALAHELVGIDNDGQALAVTEFSLRMAALQAASLDLDVPLDLRQTDALRGLEDLENACECIVGNPPYIEGRGLSAAEMADLRKRFRCAATGKVNVFAVFVERALQLLKEGGVLALILPATFRRNARYQPLREVILEHTIEAIKPLDPEIFGGRIVEPVVLRIRKQPPRKTSRVQLADGRTLQSHLPLGPVRRFCDHLPRPMRRQIEQMERLCRPLGDFCEVRDGISTGFQPFPHRLLGRMEDGVFVAGDGTRLPFDPERHRKIIDGSEFSAFSPIQWAGRYIDYDKRHEHEPPHPGRPFNCQLREKSIFDRDEKMLTRQTARGFVATVDRERHFVRNSVHVTCATAPGIALEALCACLNSRFYCDYLLAVTGESGEVFPQVHIADIRRVPLLPRLLGPSGELALWGRQLFSFYRQPIVPAEQIQSIQRLIQQYLLEAFGLQRQRLSAV